MNEKLAMTKELILFFCIIFVFPVFSRASQCTKGEISTLKDFGYVHPKSINCAASCVWTTIPPSTKPKAL
jgi:hypothetical protein